MFKLLILIGLLLSSSLSAQPYIKVLGTAQDAGYPQALCYKPHCMDGWEGRRVKEWVSSIAFVNNGSAYLFDATPSLPEQLYMLHQNDQAQVDGVFLTHAHIGHYTGLMYLGHEAASTDQLPVYAMPKLTEFLSTNGPWSQLVKLGNIRLQPLHNHQSVQLDGLVVTPLQVPHRDEYSETVGFLIESMNKKALFIPDIDKWSKWNESLSEWLNKVDYALIDATFYADGELPGRDISEVPHPFVTETMSLLAGLPHEERSKVYFIHFNHTNPLLDERSAATAAVLSAGFNIARTGLKLPM